MERPKSNDAIDLTRLLGYEEFEFTEIDGKRQVLPVEVDNYICIRPQHVGYEIGTGVSFFIHHLAKIFQSDNDPITTKETLNILNDDLQANSGKDLKIDFYPKNSTLRNDYFFLFKDGLTDNNTTKNDKYLTWMYYSQVHKKWKIDFGEIHGVRKKDTIKLVDQKAQFRIAEVLPCQALLEDDRGVLDRGKYYQVDFSQYKVPAAEMDLEQSLEVNELNKWFYRIEELVERWNGFYPDAPLEAVINRKALTLEINSPFFLSPCVTIHKDHYTDFEQIFRHVMKWEDLYRLENAGTKLNNRDYLMIDIFSNGELYRSQNSSEKYWDNGEPITLDRKKQFPIQIKIQGINPEYCYIGGLVLHADYSIKNEILPVNELNAKYAPVWLKNKNAGGEERSLVFNLTNFEKGATEENLLIKLIITNDDKLDTDFFCKGKPDMAAFKKDKVKSAAPKKEEVDLDWTVIDIPIKIVNEKGLNSEEQLKEWKKNLEALLGKDNPEAAFDLLERVLDLLLVSLREDTKDYNEVIMIGAMLDVIKHDFDSNIIDPDFYSNKKRQMERDVLSIIENIKLSKIKKEYSDNFKKTQNLLWHLATYNFLEISTEEVPNTEDELIELKKELKRLIYENSIEQALDLLLNSLNKDAYHYNRVILQGAVFKENEENNKKGIIQNEDYFANKEQTLKSILEIIDEIQPAEINPETAKEIPEPELKEELKELLYNTDIEVALSLLRESLNKESRLYESTVFMTSTFDKNEDDFRKGLVMLRDYSGAKEGLIERTLKNIDSLTLADLNENYEDDTEKTVLTETPTQNIAPPTNISQAPPNIITPNKNLQDHTPKEIGETGHFTDPRDGQRYKTVMLKDGKVWMAQNLNFDLPPIQRKGAFNRLLGRKEQASWFYNDDPENGKKYGRLYTWEGARAACPKGWHVPSDNEWWAMTEQYGKAYNDLDGKPENSVTNAGKAAYRYLMPGSITGFSAQLVGSRGLDGNYQSIDKYAAYWSSTDRDESSAWQYKFLQPGRSIYRLNDGKRSGLSCRCIQNTTPPRAPSKDQSSDYLEERIVPPLRKPPPQVM